MSLFSWQSCLPASVLLIKYATAFTSSQYALSHEYSGVNFFDGWDFYSGRDPTGGFVTYYSRSSARLTGLINTTEAGPAYMGVNYVDTLPFNNNTGQGDGAGRPSVRIASQQAFTHGLFIGDFGHIPAGICGTWPAFWTLGPNWPFTGEIDIMEGVNQNMNNIMSLHTNETCTIEGTNSSVMTGQLGNTNCAYYPDYNVGCGATDTRNTSFGTGFNQAGGGVYAMQWTSEYIRVWYWPRAEVPKDVDSKNPDPGNWGLPAGQLGVGNCTIDQHFQSHKIIFDTTFCGEYAGNPYVWETKDTLSCKASTGLATCDNFVANYPGAFRDAYWSVNYVRVYQLVDPTVGSLTATYIASEQPANTATVAFTASMPVPTLNLDTATLCPKYNFSVVSDGTYQYEIACDFDPPGPDLLGNPYPGFQAKSMGDCLKGCTYINQNNGTNRCGGVAHRADINFCYFKKYIDGPLNYRPGFNEIRLIYYGYPQISDDPRSVADSTLTSVFIETIPTPQTYRPSTVTTTTTTVISMASSSTTASLTSTIAAPPMGDNSTSTTSAVPSDYSETVTSNYLNSTNTATSSSSSIASSDPSATNADFFITFDVDSNMRQLRKRDIRYLTFDAQSQSVLTTDQNEATKFRLGSDGKLLMSGDLYVALDSNVDPPRFLLTDETPENPATLQIDGDGNVVINGANGYCLTPDGTLAVQTNSGEPPAECVIVSPTVMAATTDTTTMTSTFTSTISMTTMEGPISSTTRITSKRPITSSTSMMIETDDTSSVSSSSGADTSPPASSATDTNTSLDSSTATQSQTSSKSTPSSTSPALNNFAYAGCFGVPRIATSFFGVSTPFTDSSMTNNKCTKHCGEVNAFYAGTYGESCFCAPSEALFANLVMYPDASCNRPCPGAEQYSCGGDVNAEDGAPTTSNSVNFKRTELFRRQAPIFLISLYNNTNLLGGPGETDVPSTTSTATSTTVDTVTDPATSLEVSFPPDSVSYNITGTNTATVISTTYVDVCPVCPGGLTTKATTITVPHCGCTASYNSGLGQTVKVPSPAVPMLTTTKQCNCGHRGVQSTIVVTVPHESSIAQLASQLPAIVPPPMGIVSNDSPSSEDVQIPSPINVDADTATVASGVEKLVTPPVADETDHDQDTQDNAEVPAADDIGTSGSSESADSTSSDNESVVAEATIENNMYAAAAAASPTNPIVASNTAVPVGVSDYTAPTSVGGNGSFVGSGPVASFTSGASKSLSMSRVWVMLTCLLSTVVQYGVSLSTGI